MKERDLECPWPGPGIIDRHLRGLAALRPGYYERLPGRAFPNLDALPCGRSPVCSSAFSRRAFHLAILNPRLKPELQTSRSGLCADELIAESVNRHDGLRMPRVIFNLLPQQRYVNVNRARSSQSVVAP